MSLCARQKPVPKKIRERIYQKYDGHCAYCGCSLQYKEMQVDHLVPKYLEEFKDIQTDTEANYMPACRMCNFYKSASSLETFRKNVFSLKQRLTKIFIYRLAVKYGLVQEADPDERFYFEKIKRQLDKQREVL